MNNLEFTAIIAISSILAGLLGSLTGLGGGVVVVPLLALRFGVDLRYAIGAALVSVIATSSGAAIALYQNYAAKMAQEIEAWLAVATSTDHQHSQTLQVHWLNFQFSSHFIKPN